MAEGRTGSVLAADIGGTFTDVVLVAPDGALAIAKRLTTNDDPTAAVIAAAGELLRRTRTEARDVTRVVHGTTLATNVIIERRGAPIAFVTTRGYRSMLSLGRHARVEGERYDLFWTPPEPPVRLEHTFEIAERVDAHGNVLVPLDEAAAHELAAHIASLDIAGVAVCLLHSYRNPAHENRLGEILRAALGPDRTVALSSSVLPQIRGRGSRHRGRCRRLSVTTRGGSE
jgi:N-methylhydantoinase A